MWVDVQLGQSASPHRPIALVAYAQHLVTDACTSEGAVIGLIGVELTGWLWLDGSGCHWSSTEYSLGG